MDHKTYIEHLKSLDKVWFDALRGAGFKKNASRMVHKDSGVSVSRLGFENGYMHRFDGQSIYADTAADVQLVANHVIELTKKELLK